MSEPSKDMILTTLEDLRDFLDTHLDYPTKEDLDLKTALPLRECCGGGREGEWSSTAEEMVKRATDILNTSTFEYVWDWEDRT